MNRNARLALICAGVFALMVGVAFASVPLYKRFCQLTGFDGATRRAQAASARILDRTVVVRFAAFAMMSTAPSLAPGQVSGPGLAVWPR